MLDVGVGSGAIALAVKDERPDAQVTGVDISVGALALARENAERLGLEVELREGDGAAAAAEGWDLVVSNPPYVDGLGHAEPEELRLRAMDRPGRLGRARAARARGEVALPRLRGRRRPGGRGRGDAQAARLRRRRDHRRPDGPR